MRLADLIEKIKNITENLFTSRFYKELGEIIPYIQKYYREFIGLVPELNKIGMEIEEEILVRQLKNLLTGIEKRDRVLLFDTLQYETMEAMSLYKEITDIMEEE